MEMMVIQLSKRSRKQVKKFIVLAHKASKAADNKNWGLLEKLIKIIDQKLELIKSIEKIPANKWIAIKDDHQSAYVFDKISK